jgi:hypothetical protein
VEYFDINEGAKVQIGEFLYHKPSNRVVVCGAYRPKQNLIKALDGGRLIKDEINNFQKIKLSREEKRSKSSQRGCGGCKKK